MLCYEEYLGNRPRVNASIWSIMVNAFVYGTVNALGILGIKSIGPLYG